MENEYLTVAQVAKILQVHWQSVLNYIKRGDLEAIRIGRGYRINKKALDGFISARSTKMDQK